MRLGDGGGLAAKHFCVDGKEHRGTVRASRGPTQLRAGQTRAEANDETTIPLLPDTLDVAGSVITIAAIACRQSLVASLVACGAACVIVLNKNQKHLLNQVSERRLAPAPYLPAPTVREHKQLIINFLKARGFLVQRFPGGNLPKRRLGSGQP